MGTTEFVPVRFRLDAVLAESDLSRPSRATRAGSWPTIIDRVANDLAERVASKAPEGRSTALGMAIGRRVERGELREREPESKRGRRA